MMSKKITKYVFVDDQDTICPVCGKHPRLLCPDVFNASLPAFYICECGRVAQVGVGEVPQVALEIDE